MPNSQKNEAKTPPRGIRGTLCTVWRDKTSLLRIFATCGAYIHCAHDRLNPRKRNRQEIPYLGTRKLIYMMEPKLIEHQIKMGRDQLFDLLRFHGLLIRCRKRIARTTDSNHLFKRYPNLIKDLVITDAYSRKIVGYALHPTLEASGCIKALSMAISNWKHESPFYLIHHSDRGIQYCCAEYTELLRRYGIAISMTQNGNPYDNSLADRVNGILKNEFYPKRIYQNHQDAWKSINKIVGAYNQLRPHASVDYLTPNQAHILKNNFMPTHIGTFGVCPTAQPDTLQTPKEPIFISSKNIVDKYIHY